MHCSARRPDGAGLTRALTEYLVNEIKDEGGRVIRKEEYLLNSKEGKHLIKAVIAEILSRPARADEIKDSTQLIRSWAFRKPPRLPETSAEIEGDRSAIRERKEVDDHE